MTPKQETDLYTRLAGICRAQSNVDPYKETHCFAVIFPEDLDLENLAKELASPQYIYSKRFEDAGSPTDGSTPIRDWPITVLVVPRSTTNDFGLNSGSWDSYQMSILQLDLQNRDRDNSTTSDAAVREEEEVWRDSVQILKEILNTLHGKDYQIENRTLNWQRVSSFRNDKLIGVKCDFTLRMFTGCADDVDYDPCVDCGSDVVVSNTSGEVETISAPGTFLIADVVAEDSAGAEVGRAEPTDVEQTIVIADASVTNSDESYSVSVKAEGSLVLPDITIDNSDASYSAAYPASKDITLPSVNHTDGDGSTVATPGMKSFTCKTLAQLMSAMSAADIYTALSAASKLGVIDQYTFSTLNANLSSNKKNSIVGINPPFTGQDTSLATEDDGWFTQQDIANNGIVFANRFQVASYFNLGAATALRSGLRSWHHLAAVNEFGNFARLTDETGAFCPDPSSSTIYNAAGTATTSWGSYIIDHMTNRMYYKTLQASATWATAIANAASSTQGGYSNWELPDANTLWLFLRHEPTNGNKFNMEYYPFQTFWGTTLAMWSKSTVFNFGTTQAFITAHDGAITKTNKTNSFQSLLMRKR